MHIGYLFFISIHAIIILFKKLIHTIIIYLRENFFKHITMSINLGSTNIHTFLSNVFPSDVFYDDLLRAKIKEHD